MRVCVVGCGAVGSLFAANLAQLDDVEVWAYDLAQEHVDAINRDGLRLSGAGDVVGRFRPMTDPEAPELVEAIEQSLNDLPGQGTAGNADRAPAVCVRPAGRDPAWPSGRR